MLQFQDSAGYTWYINHLISFLVITISFVWACKQGLTGHKDKFLHYSVSAGITLFFIWFLPFVHIAWWWSPIITFLIGIVKEGYDYFHPKTHTCDIKDLVADTIGIAAFTIFYLCSFVLCKN